MLAEPAGSAGDREGHDDAVTLLVLGDAAAHLDHLTHRLVTDDVTLFHGGHETVVEMQVRTADRGRGDLDDDVGGVDDLRIGNGVDTDVFLAVPNERFHMVLLLVGWRGAHGRSMVRRGPCHAGGVPAVFRSRYSGPVVPDSGAVRLDVIAVRWDDTMVCMGSQELRRNR
jgi:hypothetical protein